MSITIKSKISINDFYALLLNVFPNDVFTTVNGSTPYKILVYLNRGDDFFKLKSLCITIVKN